jgi:biotin transport system permease protein
MLSLTLERQSWAHRVPVGWKLLGLLGATALAFPLENVSALLSLLGAVGCLYATLGRVGFMAGVRALRPIWWFVVIILGYQVLVGRAEIGVVIVLKMVALVGLANFVTMTSRISDMMALVLWLLGPLRVLGVKGGHLALAFALVIRFTPVLMLRGGLLAQAWRARSRRRANWRLVVPMAVSALDDADHVAEALRARGGVK